MGKLSLIIIGLLIISLQGCAQVKRKVPMSACPMPEKVATFEDGAIYREGSLRPLFEDRHARNVGDELIVNVGEETTAPKKTGAAAEKNTAAATKDKTADGKTKSKAKSKSKSQNEDDVAETPGVTSFSGKIIATVVLVMDNGNLLVCGDKLVKFANADTNYTYVRFSGIIHPESILSNNSVNSTDVANVQLEHRNSNSIDPTPEPGFFNRLSSYFLPKKLYF